MPPVTRLQTASKPQGPLRLDQIVLRASGLTARRVGGSVTQLTVDESMEGASTVTLTVRDPERKLLRSQFVRRRSTIILDRIQYRLVRVQKAADGVLTLTFEETAVNVLRDLTKPIKANRATVTRAQFARRLIEEPRYFRIPWRIPELNVVQPIAKRVDR